MEFLNPGLWWGALALCLPVILHFWHQKRGKELPWAAYRWLNGAVSQSARGIRLENILLLILRCLLLILLVLYLSEPLLKRSKQEKVHWIQPRKEVVDNFRFELEEAGKKGEKRFWFNGEPVKELSALPADQFTDLQLGINKVKAEGKAEIYLTDRDDFTRFTKVYLPAPYQLHLLKSLSGEGAGQENVRERQPMKVLVESEKESVSAALAAITEVYGLQFEVDGERKTGKRYDLSFTHQPDSTAGLNLVSGAKTLPVSRMAGHHRTLWFDELLNPETSHAVFNGELPEIILEAITEEAPSGRLSTRQLHDTFGVRPARRSEDLFSSVILVLFILILGAERILAIHKNS